MNYLRIAAIGSGLAGLSHITLQAYSHLGMPFYLAGFVAVGVFQIALAVWLWKGKLSPTLFWLTTLINGGATVFWLLTRVMVAPFIGGVEHFSVIGIVVVALQILSIICVCLERKNVLHFVLVLLGSVGLGFAAHFGAMQLEHHFPELKGTGGHHGGSGHGDAGHHGGINTEKDHDMSINHHDDKNTMKKHSEKMDNNHDEGADHHMSNEEHSEMMDHHEEAEKEHGHNKCDGDACPLETPSAEENESADTVESSVESSQEPKTEAQEENPANDNHDEPHGH